MTFICTSNELDSYEYLKKDTKEIEKRKSLYLYFRDKYFVFDEGLKSLETIPLYGLNDMFYVILNNDTLNIDLKYKPGTMISGNKKYYGVNVHFVNEKYFFLHPLNKMLLEEIQSQNKEIKAHKLSQAIKDKIIYYDDLAHKLGDCNKQMQFSDFLKSYIWGGLHNPRITYSSIFNILIIIQGFVITLLVGYVCKHFYKIIDRE